MRKVTLVLAAALAVSCSDSPSGPDEPESILGPWELQSIQIAGQPAASVESGLYTADFTADGHVSARADCNRCSGPYSSSGARLEIGVLACTRAYCGDESLFDEYAGALDGAMSFARSSSGLEIRYAGGVLRFAPVPQAAR
jgi:heat shock protein HslJ